MVFHSELGQLAVVALAALLCGLGFVRFKQPAIVGYILAGVILGPSALGLVENREWVAMLAELGVLLLLFVIAMKLSLRAFRTIWKVALMAAAMQIAIATVITLALSRLFGWPLELAVLLGFVVSLSSTAVAIKMLEEIGELRSETGRIVVGILIAQDLAVVPMLLLLNGMAAEGGLDWGTIPVFLAAIGLLAALIWYLSRREKLSLPFSALARRHREIVPLAAIGCCLALAAISDFLGLTAAFGAFIAGLAIGSTQERRHMIRATEPIQGVLAMVFFLSIGLLIDLA
ncbi:MAG: cation:proton antiporter, partial [Alphaproteobacteria bacterium]